MHSTMDIIEKESFLRPIKNLVNISNKKPTSFASITSKQREEYQKEIDILNELIDLEPDNELHLEMRGDLYFQLDGYYDALVDYIDVNNLAQGDDVYLAKCHCTRGIIKELAGFDGDAQEDYEIAVGFDILNPYYSFRKGCIQFKRNKIDDAIDSLSFSSECAGPTDLGDIPEFQILRNESQILMLI